VGRGHGEGTVTDGGQMNQWDDKYRIYSRISRKIYDKVMPQKLGGDLSAGHK